MALLELTQNNPRGVNTKKQNPKIEADGDVVVDVAGGLKAGVSTKDINEVEKQGRP